MTVKHFLFPHTDCNQLSTMSSWNSKDGPDPSWLSPVMDRGNGADNPAKWWVIRKPFPFGLGRTFHAQAECGCMRGSLPDLGCTWGLGASQDEAALGDGISQQQQCRAQATMRALQTGFCTCSSSLVRSPFLSDLSRRPTPPTVSPELFCPLASWQVEQEDSGGEKGEKTRDVSSPLPSCSGTISQATSTPLYLHPASDFHGAPGHHSIPWTFSPPLVVMKPYPPTWALSLPTPP